MAGFNGLAILLLGYNARIDQILTTIIIFLSFLKWISGKQNIILTKSIIILVVFMIYSVATTLLFAPDVKYSFMQTLSIISVSMIFLLLYNFIITDEQLDNIKRYFIYAGMINCTIGVVLFMLSKMGLIDYGANLVDDLFIPYGAYGTMVEPNIYGGYCLAYFIFSTTMILCSAHIGKIYYYLWGISLVGLFLSFTRGAWIAAFLGLLLIIVYTRKFITSKVTNIVGVLLLGIALYMVVSLFISDYFLSYKIENLFNTDLGSGKYRAIVWGIAIDNIMENPIFGHGTYSFATIIGDGSYDPLKNVWIGNTFLTILHDYGLIGFVLFISFMSSVIIGGLKIAQNRNTGTKLDDTNLLLSLCLAVISLYISYFFTMGNSLVYSWIFLGMIALYARKLS